MFDKNEMAVKEALMSFSENFDIKDISISEPTIYIQRVDITLFINVIINAHRLF